VTNRLRPTLVKAGDDLKRTGDVAVPPVETARAEFSDQPLRRTLSGHGSRPL
jgi:hypothetical protein